MVVASVCGEGIGELVFNGFNRVSVWDDEKALEMDGVGGGTAR